MRVGAEAGPEPARGDDPSQAHELDVLLGMLAQWVFVLRGADATLLRLGAAAERRFGAGVIGSAFGSLWREADQAELARALATLEAGEGLSEELVLSPSSPPEVLVALRLSTGTFRGQRAVFAVASELPAAPTCQEQRLRALVDNLPDAVFFIDASGRFVEVNGAACAQLGYHREELIGMPVAQVVARSGFRLEAVLSRLLRERQLIYESEHRRRDGSVIPVHLTLASIEYNGAPAIAGIARELTAQKRIEAEVRDARDRLQAILQALPDLLFEFDADGVVHDFFSSRAHLLAVSPDRLLGKTVRDVVHDDNMVRAVMIAISEAVRTGIATGVQYLLSTSVGERWMELSAAPRLDIPHGQRPRVIAIARDITERKRYEQELERRNDELMRFAYTVAHGLKSPLVTIKSFLGYLVRDLAAGGQDAVQRDVHHLQTAADRMEQLVDHLLALSTVGRKANPPERVSLRTLLAAACELLAGRIRDARAEIVPPGLEISLWGDRVRLLEVLQNLLDNAIKFSRHREHVRVVVDVARRGDEFVVCVCDEGRGIDPRYQRQLFGLFERLHPDVEGTGIGLALVKRIIEVHGGRIWIESLGEERGTTVCFTLPHTVQEAPPHKAT